MTTAEGEALERALDHVLELALLLEEDMERELGARGLTKARTRVLWEVAQRPSVHQKQLADAVGVTPRTMTGLLDGLVSTGFVVRVPDPQDRRVQRLELTARGQEAADWLVTSRRELAVDLFGDMSPRRLAGFTRATAEVVVRLRTAMERAAGGGTP